MKSAQETRLLSHAPALEEVRNGVGRIVGYAALFDTESEDLGGFVERIAPGAFAAVLQHDVRALINHDANLVLGRSTAGTLRLSEDGRGLRYEIELPDTTYARDLVAVLKRGDVSQSSFAFTVGRDDQAWKSLGDGRQLRTITRVAALHDVSVVTVPAYPQTEAALRSMPRKVGILDLGLNLRQRRLSIW